MPFNFLFTLFLIEHVGNKTYLAFHLFIEVTLYYVIALQKTNLMAQWLAPFATTPQVQCSILGLSPLTQRFIP